MFFLALRVSRFFVLFVATFPDRNLLKKQESTNVYYRAATGRNHRRSSLHLLMPPLDSSLARISS